MKSHHWLVVSIPLENMRSIGIMTFPGYGRIKHAPVTTNQHQIWKYIVYIIYISSILYSYTLSYPTSKYDIFRWYLYLDNITITIYHNIPPAQHHPHFRISPGPPPRRAGVRHSLATAQGRWDRALDLAHALLAVHHDLWICLLKYHQPRDIFRCILTLVNIEWFHGSKFGENWIISW